MNPGSCWWCVHKQRKLVSQGFSQLHEKIVQLPTGENNCDGSSMTTTNSPARAGEQQ